MPLCARLFIVSALDYKTFDDCYMIGGVGQSGNHPRNYWVDASSGPMGLNATWRQRAVNAVYDWNHTGSAGCGVYTSVWFQQTTHQHISVLDFHRDDDLGNGFYGFTDLYLTSGEQSPMNINNPSNWVWGKCRINVYYCNNGRSIDGNNEDRSLPTPAKKRAIFEHEMGHVMGLDDLLEEYSNKLMAKFQFHCTATKPTTCECSGINHLYGGYNP